MVNFYIRKIKDGTITIDDVAPHWKADVEAKLKEEGYLS